MNYKIRHLLAPTIITFILMLASSLIAQNDETNALINLLNFGEGYVEFEMMGCDEKMHDFSIQVLTLNEDTNVATFKVSIDGRSRTFTVDLDVVNDVTDESQLLNDPQWKEYINFMQSALGCGFGAFGGAAVPADPLVAQNIQTFQNNVFSIQAEPHAALRAKPISKPSAEPEKQDQEEEEKTKAAWRKPNEASSDVEYEFFDINGLNGNNLAIHAGFSRTSDDGKFNYGGDFLFNRLAFKDAPESIGNSTVSLFGNNRIAAYQMGRTCDNELTMGWNANYLIMDDKMSDENGFAFGLSLIDRMFWQDGKLFVAGSMVQSSFIGDISSFYINVAAMFGLPIADKLSVNCSALYTEVIQYLDKQRVSLGNPRFLNIGAHANIFISYAFGMNVGVKKTFLVKDYSSFEITLGSRFRF